MIDPTKRAMAIRVNDVSGVAGFVTPGDRVDVLLTRRLDGDNMITDHGPPGHRGARHRSAGG